MKISLPENKKEITVGQYQKYNAIEEPTTLDSVSIFCNISMDIVKGMKQKDILEIDNHLANILSKEDEFIAHKPIEFNGATLCFEPNFQGMKAAAFLDLENFFDIYSEDPKVHNWHKAAAVMFRPIDKRYKDKYSLKEYSYSEDLAEDFKDFPLTYLLGARGFFLSLFHDCLISTLSYIREEAKQKSKQLDSLKSGGSIRIYIQQLEESIVKLSVLRKKKQ